MSIEQLPLMAGAFRTTLSGLDRYEMIFRFKTMEEMHAADDEWRAALSPSDPEPAASSQPVEMAGWPERWKFEGFNGCISQAAKALRYLAVNARPIGGEQFPNSACCYMIADELDGEIKRRKAHRTAARSGEGLREALERILACVDGNGDGCYDTAEMVAGMKQNGQIVLKGSFITECIRARAALAATTPEEKR